jgi:hypothetical protein
MVYFIFHNTIILLRALFKMLVTLLINITIIIINCQTFVWDIYDLKDKILLCMFKDK